ncbi:MAG: hypothetical protein GX265_03815 [Mollicutes bacterium]|nr:hypothetical protein [Mollicutes bacterium]
MLNKEYVRQLVKDILSINKIENVYILNSINGNVKGTKLYTVYINVKAKSNLFDIPLENIYPFTHKIDSVEYQYNNLSEEEIKLLEEVLRLLGVNVLTISISELLLKKKVVSKVLDDVFKKIAELKEDIKILESDNKIDNVYIKEKELNSIINDLEKLNIYI